MFTPAEKTPEVENQFQYKQEHCMSQKILIYEMQSRSGTTFRDFSDDKNIPVPVRKCRQAKSMVQSL